MGATEDRENWATDGARTLHEQTVKARELKMEGKSNAEIAEALGIPENNVRQYVRDEINWGYNCLTAGIHHGRPEALWNLPLYYAATVLFDKDTLKEIVISRIYNDAMQYVGTDDQFDQDWANRVKQEAEQYYMSTLQHKVGELSNFYSRPEHKRELRRSVARRVTEDKLNPFYEPLHSHDSINLLCRILGTSASRRASGG